MKLFQFFIFIFLLIEIINPQNITVDNTKDFEKALELYNKNKLDDALLIFQKIEKRTENNNYQSISSFFICKIYSDQKKCAEAENTGKMFLSRYPKSKYSDEVKNLIIKSFLDRGDFQNALGSCVEYLAISKSIVFNKETKNIAEKIALNNFSASGLDKLLEKYDKTELKPFLLLLSGKILLNEGEIANANKKFTEITTSYISSEEYIEALNLKKQHSSFNTESPMPIVSVILSLTDQNGRDIESAGEILEGIKFAFHQFNTVNKDRIGIFVHDIGRDKEKTNEAIDESVNDNGVRCILGPVFSDDVRNALKEIGSSGICLISPTATDADLIDLNENFYQANPSLSIRGKIFAQYLYFVEGKRKIAVINSIEGYSPLIAAGFMKEFENLGGRIIAKETYKSKSYSLAEQINRIASMSGLVEGIYAPISDPNDATALLSQMVQSGLDVNIYGNQDWFLGKGFESSSASADKLTFESDYFIEFNDPELKTLSTEFKKITGKEINRNVLYGYDTAKYILTVMRNIDPTRKNIKNKIESGISVTGFHNNISFDSERINKYLNIVRYQDEVFELVDKFRSGK